MFRYLYREAKLKENVPIFIALLILVSLSSILSVYPVILIRDVVDLAVVGEYENIKLIVLYGSIYLVFQILRSLIVGIIGYLSKKAQSELAFQVQLGVFQNLENAKLSDVKISDSSTISSTLIQDTQYASENLVEPFSDLIQAVFTFIFGLYFMFKINLYLTLLVLPLGLISSIAIKLITRKYLNNISKQREKTTLLWKVFNEGILGFLPIRLHGYTDKYIALIRSHGQSLRDCQTEQGKLESLRFFTTSALFMTTIGLIMIFSSIFVVKDMISIGGLTAIMMYNHMLVDPLIDIQEIIQKLVKLRVSASRIYQIMSLPQNADTQHPVESDIDEVTFTDVEFRFGEETIFHNLNIQIPSNSSVTICGQTGAGKSTFVNLLAGIYSPTQGSIQYKKKNSDEYGKPKISYMLQDEYLFDDSIVKNILIGNPNLSEGELNTIIDICELKEVISRHHDQPIGENGVLLSGGERKRILVARTLADTHSAIYIFDEMSSSLDNDTFVKIWNRVDQRLLHKIRVYIEHNQGVRFSTDYVLDIKKDIIVMAQNKLSY